MVLKLSSFLLSTVMSTPSPPIIDKHIHRDGDEEADTSSDANGDADADGDEGDVGEERY